MSLVFLVVNGQTNAITYAGRGKPDWMVDHGSFIAQVDDTMTGVSDLLTNVNAHTYDSIMGSNPYLTALYDGSNVQVTAHNGTASTVTFSVLGSAYTQSSPFALSVHPSVKNQRVTVGVQVPGFPYIYVECGAMNEDVQRQFYKDSAGTLHVVPYKNVDLANYWTSQSFDATWQMPDIATIDGLLLSLVTRLVQATNLTLTADEQNGLNDLINNVVPNIPVDLAHIAPVPASGQAQSFDGHYHSYRGHMQATHQAMTNYMQDVTDITQYVPLH